MYITLEEINTNNDLAHDNASALNIPPGFKLVLQSNEKK